MSADPHTDYGPAWTDPADLHTRCCRLEAQNAALRARIAQLEAERDDLDTRLCHATIHDGRDGRLGLRSLWQAWFGPKAVRL